MSRRQRSILLGIVSGALLGALIAWIYAGAQEEERGGAHAIPRLGPMDWVRLGLVILGAARQIGEVVKRV
ncbi:MAG: hypothetical protein RML36_12075 [Anaerolineae bacterium]|nr:hypothetical protein [Anaerolineae bacterium]MDW8100207.1 hypothetical protein [Anaerolineae bacterium]